MDLAKELNKHFAQLKNVHIGVGTHPETGTRGVKMRIGDIHVEISLADARLLAEEISRTVTIAEAMDHAHHYMRSGGFGEFLQYLHGPEVNAEDAMGTIAHDIVCDCDIRSGPTILVNAHCGHDLEGHKHG